MFGARLTAYELHERQVNITARTPDRNPLGRQDGQDGSSLKSLGTQVPR